MTINITVDAVDNKVSVAQNAIPIGVQQNEISLVVLEDQINVNLEYNTAEVLFEHTNVSVAVEENPIELYLVNAANLVQNFGEVPQSASFVREGGKIVQIVKEDETKILTYNDDGLLATIDDGTYLKTFNYSSGVLSSTTVALSGA